MNTPSRRLIPANTLFPRLARYLIVVAATLALPVMSAFPIRAAAQERHHYKLIDTGTFGGPMSFLNLSANGVPALNIQGTTVGDSNTATLQTSISDGFVCAGTFSGVPYVFHAFALRNGVVSDLGALPPTDENCSNAGSVNANGEISGTSEVDEIDPVLGTKKFRAVLWKEGEIVNLGTFGGAYSVGGVVAGAINNHSQVVGAALNAIPDPFSLLYQLAGSPNGTQTRAFLWQNGHMLDLQTLGGPDAWAYFVNERGQIAGSLTRTRHRTQLLAFQTWIPSFGSTAPCSISAHSAGLLVNPWVSTIAAKSSAIRAWLQIQGHV